ncbi:7580_t:CDS:2, partial [Funneliformis mosseae]
KQKAIHVWSNVIDEHLHASTESTTEFTKFTMKVENHDKADTTGYHTPERHTTPEDDKEGENGEEEEDDEYNADQTIIGGKSTNWIVNGVRIRESLTQYQLDKNSPKTKSEYYDVIFLNSNDKDGFLSTLDESIVEQMCSDIRMKEEKTKDNIKQDIKIFLDNIIDLFALKFVSHMIKLMDNVNWLIELMSEGTYIVNVLAPILSEFFTKNKQYWCASYGETCLRASAMDRNSNKADNERRSNGNKIDTIISLREEDKDFSVTETLMNQFAEFNPSSDITLIKLYGLQSYLNELTIYEFQLKYTEIYTMEIILTFPLPKTWADMAKAHKTVMGLLDKGGSKKMTTRMINSPTESVEKTKSTATIKKTKSTMTAKKLRKQGFSIEQSLYSNYFAYSI